MGVPRLLLPLASAALAAALFTEESVPHRIEWLAGPALDLAGFEVGEVVSCLGIGTIQSSVYNRII
jgi:hypothetical protein